MLEVPGEVVGTGLRNRVGQSGDRGAGLDLIERLHRRRRSGGRSEGALGVEDSAEGGEEEDGGFHLRNRLEG